MTDSSRLAGIRAMLKDPKEQTAPNNQAICWRADCEYLLVEVDMLREDLEETVPHLRALASQCEACEGSGELIDQDDEARECKYCRPIWRLVERFTPKPALPVITEVEDDILF